MAKGIKRRSGAQSVSVVEFLLLFLTLAGSSHVNSQPYQEQPKNRFNHKIYRPGSLEEIDYGVQP
jgi:hypothetical protein